MQPIFPKALQRGDTLGLVAPAGVVDRELAERAIGRLEEAGFAIRVYGDLFRARGYLAGDDATRATEINAAFADPEVAAVIPVRGGYGITRIVDQLDFEALGRHPKIVTGFSDITALHLAIWRTTGLVTFHTPNLIDGLGTPEGLSDLSARTFWRAVLAEQYQGSSSSNVGPGYELPLTEAERQKVSCLVPGTARGPIVGGNLSLVCALLGSPYEIDPAGCLLLLEDVDEQPYHIDRFFSELRLAGKFDRLAGVILGQFTDCLPSPGKASLTMDEVLSDYFAELGVPVLKNYPIGHAADNATVPLGVEAEMDTEAGRITLLEDPVVT